MYEVLVDEVASVSREIVNNRFWPKPPVRNWRSDGSWRKIQIPESGTWMDVFTLRKTLIRRLDRVSRDTGEPAESLVRDAVKGHLRLAEMVGEEPGRGRAGGG